MTRVVDLSLTLSPALRGVAFEPRFNFAEHGWNAQTLHLYSHCGTHVDAPVHSQAGPETVDALPLDRFMGPAWVVRLTGVAPRALLGVSDLGAVADRLKPGESLLLHTGWSRHARDPAMYRDALPRVGPDLARWCVARKVKLLGVEPPSVADVNNLPEVISVHQTLLGGGVLIVEGLAGLEALTRERVFFGALPLKIAAGDGSPVRAFAIEGLPGDDWKAIGSDEP